MQNISLFIGDNAHGKTRLFKKIITEEKEKGKRIVTNIESYRLRNYMIDEVKYERVKNVNNQLVDRIVINKSINIPADAEVDSLLKLIYAQGDILILDEMDACITAQEIIHVSMIISEIKDTWEKIYVNGYSTGLLRMFTNIDPENGVETRECNVYCVKENMEIGKLGEDEIIEYIDSIRG